MIAFFLIATIVLVFYVQIEGILGCVLLLAGRIGAGIALVELDLAASNYVSLLYCLLE